MLGNITRLKCMVKYLIGDPYKKELIELTQYTILKYPRVFQNTFYMLDYEREEICEEGTNMLDWKKANKLINEDFFKKLENYTQRGQKIKTYPKYRMLNTIEKQIEEYKEEDVFGYSTALGQLLKWMKESIKVRKQDIIARKLRKQAEKENIEQKKKEKEEWEKKREEELQSALKDEQAEWQAKIEKQKKEKEEEDEFAIASKPPEKKAEEVFNPNLKELMEEWDSKNPAPEIPLESPEELDNDCIVELPPPS